MDLLPETTQWRLLSVLLHFLWQGTVIALAMAGVMALLRSPRGRYAVVLLGFLMLASAPVATWCWLNEPVRHEDVSMRVVERDEAAMARLPSDETPPMSLPEFTSDVALPVQVERDVELLMANSPQTTEFDGARAAAQWALRGWVLGVCVLSLRLLLGAVAVWRWRWQSLPLSESLHGMLEELQQRWQLKLPAVRLSDRVRDAVALGLFKPMILVPISWATELPPDMLEAVLAHELAHVRRFDLWVNVLQGIVETLLFYHPAVWWLSRRLRIERELCCDEWAANLTNDRLRYAEMLECVARLSLGNSTSTLSLAVSSRGGELLRRVRQVLQPVPQRSGRSAWIGGLLAFACLLLIGVSVGSQETVDAPDVGPVEVAETDNAPVEAAKDDLDAAIKAAPVLVDLPGGRSVELVGITKNTAPAKDGWKPNGTPMGDVGDWRSTIVLHGKNSSSAFTEGGVHPEPDADAIDVLVRFRGLKEQPSLTFDMATNGSSYHQLPLKDPYEIRVSTRRRGEPFPGAKWSVPDGEVRIGLTDAPWGKWVQISPEGDVLNPSQAGERYHRYYDAIRVHDIVDQEQAPNKKALIVCQPIDGPSLYVFEMRGIGEDDKPQWVLEYESGVKRDADLRYAHWGLGSAEKQPLKRYEFRLRPYRHWVTVTGVQFEPGKPSKVETSLKTIPDSDRETATIELERPDPKTMPTLDEFEKFEPKNARQTSLTLTQIKDRLQAEEAKYTRFELTYETHQRPDSKKLNGFGRTRFVRDGVRSYFFKQHDGIDHRSIVEEVVLDRWKLHRLEWPSRPAQKVQTYVSALPTNQHPLSAHQLMRPLSGLVPNDFEVAGEERVGDEWCVKLASQNDPVGGNQIWLALNKNLIPARCEIHGTRQSKPLTTFVVVDWTELKAGVWLPKRQLGLHHRLRVDGVSLQTEIGPTLVVTQATLDPVIDAKLFEKLGQPPKHEPPQTVEMRSIEVRLLGEQQQPLSDVLVEVTQGYGADQKKFGPFKTDADGTMRCTLPRGSFYFHLKSDRELPYLPVDVAWDKSPRGPTPNLVLWMQANGPMKFAKDKEWPESVEPAKGASLARVTYTLLRATELTLRAIDAETGKGLSGVEFYEENAVGEDWAHDIEGHNIGAQRRSSKRIEDSTLPTPGLVTDKDGNFIRLVGANDGFKYGVAKSPVGYVLIEPQAEVEIPIVFGQARAERVFKFTRSQALPGNASSEAPPRVPESATDLASGGAAGKAKFEAEPREARPQAEPGNEKVTHWAVKLVNGQTDEPLAGVEIRSKAANEAGDAEETRTFKSDAQGLLTIPHLKSQFAEVVGETPGWWMPRDRRLLIGDTSKLSDSRRDPATPIVVRLWPGTQLVGRLVKPDGQPAASVRCYVGIDLDRGPWSAPRPQDPSARTPLFANYAPNWEMPVTTNTEGLFCVAIPQQAQRRRFQLLAIPETSSINLSLRWVPDFWPLVAPDGKLFNLVVEFQRDQPDAPQDKDGKLDLGVLKLSHGVDVQGQVVDANNQPMPNVDLKVYHSGSQNIRRATTDAEGRFTLTKLPPMRLGVMLDLKPTVLKSLKLVDEGRPQEIIVRVPPPPKPGVEIPPYILALDDVVEPTTRSQALPGNASSEALPRVPESATDSPSGDGAKKTKLEAEPRQAHPQAEPGNEKPEVDEKAVRQELEEKTRDLQKAIADLTKARDAKGDTSRFDRDVAMVQVRVASLQLKLAEASHRAQPGMVSDEDLKMLKRETLVRWGASRDGVQIGLERVALKDSFTVGEPVEFRHRVRNTKAEEQRVTLRFAASNKVVSVLHPANRFVVNALAPVTESFSLTLAPGADAIIEGAQFQIDTKGMIPDRFHLESYVRFVLNESKVVSEQIDVRPPGWTEIPRDLDLKFNVVATRSQALPGNASSEALPRVPESADGLASDEAQKTKLEAEPPQARPQALPGNEKSKPFDLQGGADIFWGSPLQGLQLGLRYTRPLKHPNQLQHSENWIWKIDETVKAELLVRNVTATPSPVTYRVTEDDKLLELDPYSGSVSPYDNYGPIQPRFNKTRIARDGNEPTNRERTKVLEPGEMLLIATQEFQLLKRPAANDEEWRKLPRVNSVLVEPDGLYRLVTNLNVRRSLASSITLPTGKARLWMRDAYPQPEPVQPVGIAGDSVPGQGRVTLRYKIPKAAPQATFVIRPINPIAGMQRRTVRNDGLAESVPLDAGRYEVAREITLKVGGQSGQNTVVECQRQRFDIAVGKDTAVNFLRDADKLLSAKGQWKSLREHSVRGAFLTVHPIGKDHMNAETPDAYIDYEAARETLAATTCGPDGIFEIEPLPAGRYVMILRAFQDSANDPQKIVLPYIVGAETFNIYPHSDRAHFYPNDFRLHHRWTLQK